MSGGLIAAIVVVVTLVASVALARMVNHPERAATHDDGGTGPTTSDRFYSEADRPAGPDAEDPRGPTRGEHDDG